MRRREASKRRLPGRAIRAACACARYRVGRMKQFGWIALALIFLVLSVVLVAIIAAMFLGEKLSPGAWAGVGLIAGGAVLVALN